MDNDKLKGLFIIWGVILFIELIWLWSISESVHSISELIFAVTIIGVTCVFGSVGFSLFKTK
ncbi:MAG TPA: hypothetical protein VNR38_05075 [Ureibacillus sp.]|nr:hypothetical protein [Ureibacillus sp.]